MLTFLNLEPEIFGVDVNDQTLRIAKLQKKRKGFAVVSFNEVDIKPGIIKEGLIQDQDALAKIIASACATVKGKKLGTKFVAISLPEEKSFSQIIQMPAMTREELETAVPLEAENYIPLTIDKVYLDFEPLEPSAQKADGANIDLLINVMPRPVVDSYVECFKKAGLVPVVLEVESQAIARSLIKKGDKTAPTIFIDLGNANTSFILFCGNSVHFTASIPISSQQITEAIAKRFEISFAKAEELKIKYGASSKKPDKKYDIYPAMEPVLLELVAQIKKYIAFYRDHISHAPLSADTKIEKIVLCGGAANLKELPDFLTGKLKISAEIGNAFSNIIVSKKGDANLIPSQKAPSCATVLGLALRTAESI